MSNFRQMTIKKMRQLCKEGLLSPFIFDERPEDYINKMKVSGAYVDELFLRVMACVIQSNIILIHLNKHTATNAVYTWLKGGELLSETAGPKCPLFLGNVLFSSSSLYLYDSAFYEESVYKAGHYQSIFPITDNWTLRDIKRLGGFDVTTFLNLSEGEFVLYSFKKVFLY